MLKVHGEGEGAEFLRAIFRQSEEKTAARREQDDKDFERVAPRLEWLLESQYVVSPEFLSHDTGVPLARIEAIEDRLGTLAQEVLGEGCYCP